MKQKYVLLSPLVLAADLVLFLRSEVILYVESFPDLFWRFSLDHIGHGLAADVEKGFDVQVVGGLSIMLIVISKGMDTLGAHQNDFEEHFLVDLHKLLVPFVDIGRLLSRI